MFNHSLGGPFRPTGHLFQILSGCGFGLLLGIACLRYSVLLVMGILAAVLFVYATLKKPEIALVGVLVATSSIIFEEQLPQVAFGGVSFHIPDILLLGLLGLIFFRWLAKPAFKIVRTPLDWPILVFFAVTLLSTVLAISRSSVDIVDARRAIRVLSYYLMFFIVTNLVRGLRGLDFLLKGLFLLATAIAAGMIVQFVLGPAFQLLPGYVASLGTQAAVYKDVTRIVPPGLSTVFVSFGAVACILVLETTVKRKWPRFLQLALTGIGLLLTFLRSYWIALIFVFLLLGHILRGDDRRKLIKWGLVSIGSGAVLLLFIFSFPDSRVFKLASASIDRVSTLGRSGTFQGEDSSVNWRKIENRYAVSAILSHPLIGLGMGAKYRPWDPRLDWRDADGKVHDYRKNIHNGYLWILLQSGVIGFLSLAWISVTFLIRGFRNWRDIANERLKGIVLGFTLIYMAILIAAPVNSVFSQWHWIPVIGIIMGTNEVILRHNKKKVHI